MSDAEQSFATLWESLLPVGRDSGTGGYRRFSWTPADASARSWFMDAAAVRNLRTYADRNGNLWASWDPDPEPVLAAGAIVTGSHLDSVPDGGAYDGPLGVVTAFAAIDMLRERGRRPARPVTVSRHRPCGQIPAASPTAAPRSASARPCSMCSST